MKEEQIMHATGENSSPIALLVGIDHHPITGFFLLYLIITALSILVYKLGFARKLPILKSFVVYFVLVIGCFPLTFFGIGMPVAEGLIVASFVLGVYKYRLYQSKKEQARL